MPRCCLGSWNLAEESELEICWLGVTQVQKLVKSETQRQSSSGSMAVGKRARTTFGGVTTAQEMDQGSEK